MNPSFTEGFMRRAITAGLLTTSASAILLGTLAAPAAAQGASSPSAPASTAAEEREAIIVTGSRIRRVDFDSLEPTIVVSSQYLEARGLTNVADALNEIPSFGVGVTPEGGQSSFGVGQNFVNRFGLGTARTLTLVNGRRFVSSNAPSIFGPAAPGLQVDLNVIPSIMIDRVENIAIGGAAAYGSDAIAGTVNIILRNNFDGVEVRGLGGISDKADAARYNLSALAGKNFGADDRGNIAVALSYDETRGTLSTSRERYRQALVFNPNPLAGSAAANFPVGRSPENDGRVNTSVPFNTGNADGIPNSVLIRNSRIFGLTPGGVLFPATGAFLGANNAPNGFGPGGTTRLRFDENGNLVDYNFGIPFGTQNASGGDGLFLNETLPLLTDLQRFTANLNGRYEFSRAFGVFVEGTYYRADALELIDQPIYNATLFGGLSAPLRYQATDPRLTDQARARLQQLGVTSFRLSRGSRDIVTNNAESRQELYRIVGGLEGEFNLFGKNWYWEASANYGHSEGTFGQTVLDVQRFANAVNVARDPATGRIVCNVAGVTAANNVAPSSPLPIADPACVPLDLFGEGRASPEALAYVTTRTRALAILEQEVYNANVGGSLLTLWAGDLQFAAGYEHRVERGEFRPDDFQQAGRGRAVAIGPNEGQFNTDEVFGEIVLPLASPDNGWTLLYSVDVEAKARYVDNSVNGGFWAYTLGGRYRPIRDVEFRGNYTRSLRAPAITELFTPIGNIFTTVPDPCDSRNVAGGARPEVRARNCAAFYAFYNLNPATFQSVAVGATVPGTSGGDPNLDNEEANSWTVGVVLRPSFLPRFRAAVDWNSVSIVGNIANLGAADLATGCFDNDNFNAADVPNANQFCSRLRRTPDGQIVNDPQNPGVITGFVNGAFIDFRGLTSEFAYNFPLWRGTVDLGGTVFYLKTLTTNNNGVVANPDAGEIGNPKFEGQLNLGYTLDNFGVDLQTRYTGKAKFNNLNTVETQDILEVDAQWLFNLSFSLRVAEDHLFRFTVTNLTDTPPPFPIAGIGTYDTLGRRFAVSFQSRF
jgi:outer membrane receptor protein involved in Fe transport